MSSFFSERQGHIAGNQCRQLAFDLGTYTESFVDVMAGLGLASSWSFRALRRCKGGLSFGDDSSSVYSYTGTGMGTCLGVDVGANLDLALVCAGLALSVCRRVDRLGRQIGQRGRFVQHIPLRGISSNPRTQVKDE